MKIGIIGVGRWGKVHAGVYAALGHELYVSDLNAENMRHCEIHHGAKSVGNYEDILRDDSIQAVSICTPNETHYQIARQALQHGKDVLLEKPMTTSYEDALDLVRLTNEGHRVLVVGYEFRFSAAVRKMRNMVEKREFGDIYTVDMSWTSREPVFDKDIIFDLAPHPTDILRYTFDRSLDYVSAVGGAFRREGGNEAAYIIGRMGEIIVSLSLSWLIPEKVRVARITGSDRTALFNFDRGLGQPFRITVQDFNTGEKADIEIPWNNPLKEELEFFLDNVNNRTRYKYDPMIDAGNVRVLEDMKNSIDVLYKVGPNEMQGMQQQ